MESFQVTMNEYKKMLKKGDIQKAYQGLMEYFRDLRSHFHKKYPGYSVPSNIYNGYMDMTYFAIVPESLRSRNLKIAIVFVYDVFRFEVWLSGSNRNIQTKFWNLINENKWHKYKLSSNPKTDDSIIEHILVDDPDFNDLDTLTKQIEVGTLEFIEDVESFFSKH